MQAAGPWTLIYGSVARGIKAAALFEQSDWEFTQQSPKIKTKMLSKMCDDSSGDR